MQRCSGFISTKFTHNMAWLLTFIHEPPQCGVIVQPYFIFRRSKLRKKYRTQLKHYFKIMYLMGTGTTRHCCHNFIIPILNVIVVMTCRITNVANFWPILYLKRHVFCNGRFCMSRPGYPKVTESDVDFRLH